MLKNYFVTFLRLLKKKPGFYLLNILALSVSISTFLVILQYTTYHFNFDSFHQFKNDTYRVVLNYHREGREPYVGAAVFPKVGPALVEEFPEVEMQCRIVPIPDKGSIYHNDQHFPVDHIQYVDSTFFDLFGYRLLSGHPKRSLQQVRSAVISDRIAETLFRDQNPLNQSIRIQTIDGSTDYLIGGVFEYKENSHLKSDILLSFSSLLQLVGEQANTNWSWFDYVTYIKLNGGVSAKNVTDKFPEFIDKHGGERLGSKAVSFDLQPLMDIHLKSNLNQEIEKNADYFTIIFLLIISVVVLVIAWINYINLYTAKANERSKEVGIRKTNGSTKTALFLQFMFEAALLNLVAFGFALALVKLTAPLFETWLGIKQTSGMFNTSFFWLILILAWFVSTVISGAYPSLVLARLQPLQALVASKVKARKVSFRKGMITWQFIASSGLIMATLVIGDQLRYMKKQSLGVNIANTHVLEVPDYGRNAQSHITKIRRIKSELVRLPGVSSVSYSSDVPGKEVGWRGSSYRIDQASSSRSRELIMKMTVGADFIKDYEVDLVAGHGYSSPNDTTSVLINEEAIQLYGFDSKEEALNSRIYFPGVDTLRIVGITENFHQESLKEAYKPTAYLLTPREIKYLSIRMQPGQDLPDLSSIFESNLPNQPIEPMLLTDRLQAMHQEEVIFLRAFNLFTFLALLLSVVGIVGLASFTVSKREKEIAIRKVLGSRISTIIWNILKEILILVAIANLLLVPITYYSTNEWLNTFAFHTSFNWLFPLASLLSGVLLVVLFSFGHIWKVANMNPNETLSKEK